MCAEVTLTWFIGEPFSSGLEIGSPMPLQWSREVIEMGIPRNSLIYCLKFFKDDLPALLIKGAALMPLIYYTFQTKLVLPRIIEASIVSVLIIPIVTYYKYKLQYQRSRITPDPKKIPHITDLLWEVAFPYIFGLIISVIRGEYFLFLSMVIISSERLGAFAINFSRSKQLIE